MAGSPALAQARLADIVVAAVGSPRSPLNPAEGDVAAGVRAAAERINEAGGLHGRRIAVVEHLDACSATSGAEIAARVVADGARLAIGHLCSSSAIAAATVYQRHDVLMISTGARAPRLTDPRGQPLVLRLAGRDDRLGEDAARLIADRFASPRVAIVHDKSLEARTLADQAATALAHLEIKPVLREAYVAGEREYNALSARIAASGADVAIIPAQPIEAGIIFGQWQAARADALLLAGPLIAVPEFTAMAERHGDRIVVLLPVPRAALTADDAADLNRFRRTTAAAAVDAFAHAARLQADLSMRAIAERMRQETAATAIGEISFDRKGDARLPSFQPFLLTSGGWRPWQPQSQPRPH